MKNIVLWISVFLMSFLLLAGCARGNVAENGVNSGEEMRSNVRSNDLYEDDTLFMEDVEEEAEHLKENAEQGIDNAQESLERGMHDLQEDFTDNTTSDNEEITAQSGMTGREM